MINISPTGLLTIPLHWSFKHTSLNELSPWALSHCGEQMSLECRVTSVVKMMWLKGDTGVAGTRIPQSLRVQLLKEKKYSSRREELGQRSRIPGVQGPQREPREHCVWPINHQVRKGNGGTRHSQWLRTWQVWGWPRSGALSLPLSSSVQISIWFQDQIWDSFVIDKSQDFASASGITLGASYIIFSCY